MCGDQFADELVTIDGPAARTSHKDAHGPEGGRGVRGAEVGRAQGAEVLAPQPAMLRFVEEDREEFAFVDGARARCAELCVAGCHLPKGTPKRTRKRKRTHCVTRPPPLRRFGWKRASSTTTTAASSLTVTAAGLPYSVIGAPLPRA